MNILNEHYRQLLNNWNFSKENRLVFQEGETPEAPTEDEKKEEKKPAEAVPSNDEAPNVAGEKVAQAEEEGNKAVEPSEKSIDQLADGGPKTTKAEAKAKPEVQLKKPDDDEDAEKQAKPATKAETKAEAPTKSETEKPPEKLKENRKKATAKLEKAMLNKLKGVALIMADSREPSGAIDMAINGSQMQKWIDSYLNSLTEEQIKQMEKGEGLATKKEVNKILNTIIGKPKETEEQKAEKTKFINEHLDTLMKRLSALPDFKSLNTENPQMQEMAKELLAVMSKDRLMELKESKTNISEEEKGKMEKIAVKHIQKIDKGDRIEKGEPELLDNWADKLGLSYEDELEEGKPLNKIIALKFKIEKGDNDKEIKINGDTVKSKEDLMTKIKAEDSELAEKLTKYETAGDNEKDELLEGLEKYAGDSVEAHEAMAKMAESLDSPEAIKKMGGLAGLFALLQLIPTIMKALKDGDFSVVNEMLADYKKGENPAKKISESKKNYSAFFEKGKGKDAKLKTLLSVYKDPKTSNKDANDLFCGKGKSEDEIKQDPLSKYRFMAKPAIKGKFVEGLGLGRIEEIKLEEGVTEIDGYKRDTGERVSIRLYEEGGILQANIRGYESVPQSGGGEIMQKAKTSIPVANADWDTIKDALGGGKSEGKSEVADSLTKDQMEQIGKKRTEVIKAIREGFNNKDVKVKVLYDMKDSSYKISILSKNNKVLSKASFKPNEITDKALNALVTKATKKYEEEVPYNKNELATTEQRMAAVNNS